MNKAVQNGVLSHVSATQITNYVACKRLWFFDKVLGLTPEQTPAQRGGDNMHKQLDAYYKGLTLQHNPEVREAVMHPSLVAALAALPPPGPDVLSEHPHDYNLGITAADVPVMGRIDLLHFCGPRTPTVIDLKTKSKSSFKKFILTPEQLQENLQMLIYAKYCVEKHDAAIVILTHLNVCKDEPKYKAVSTSLSRDDLLHKYAHLVVKPVEEMKRTALLTSVDSLPTMEDAAHKPCYAYGKCPFFQECFGVKTAKKEPNMFDDLPSGTVSTSLTSSPNDSPIVQPATSMDFVILIDCLPVKGSMVQPLEDIIARHSAPICQANKVTDVREIDFGKGSRALIASMLKETWVGTYTTSSQGLGGLVSEALIPLAKTVIRGVR